MNADVTVDPDDRFEFVYGRPTANLLGQRALLRAEQGAESES
jgi:hypothetical protein